VVDSTENDKRNDFSINKIILFIREKEITDVEKSDLKALD
jgi:hypothetical protein